ncbi:MAG: ATP-binding protein [Deltaproteobacteria bacterium]|nr:ATP-binding protein [Deltaproteobacteria bacterium]
MLVGARQTGKTTLARDLAAGRPGMRYLTFDDVTTQEAATADPAGFVSGIDAAVLDEVQRAPALLSAIKVAVDRDRRPGRFLLTGSANVLLLPRVSESLAGRLEVATLWPFSMGEVLGKRETFVDDVLAGRAPSADGGLRLVELVRLLLRGGYPEAVVRERPARRRAFFESYVVTLLQRDVRDLAAIEMLGGLRQLLRLAAARTGSLLNHSEVARSLGLPVSTAKRYLALLEMMFLVHLVPAWSGNRSKRLVRSPKLHMVDTGLSCALAGLDEAALSSEPTLVGPILESFVAAELAKQASWSEARPTIHHFRTHGGQEVDLVLEDARGRVVGIEVKARSTVRATDLAGLRALAEAAGRSFVQGIVLYGGEQAVPFGDRLTASPIASLWGSTARGARR